MKLHEIKEIDDHIDSFEAAAAPDSLSAASLSLFNICQVWAKARPIIVVGRNLLFWKPKWQAVIDEVIASLDLSCTVA